MKFYFKPLLDWLAARGSEKSTWVGLIALAAAVTGHSIAPDMAVSIDSIAATIAGVVLVFTKADKGDVP